jgi:hypothetical protein
MRIPVILTLVALGQAAVADTTIGLNFCDRYTDPHVSDGVADGFAGWTDSRAIGDTTNAAVQSTPLALGTSGVTATWTASNSWAGGAQGNNEQGLYRVYLDDGGSGVRVTISGLSAWLAANGNSSYRIRCYSSSDNAATFSPISIRDGATATSPVLHTMTPATLGDGNFPTVVTPPVYPSAARGYVDSPDTLTADTITLTIPPRSSSSVRGTLAAFKITGVGIPPSAGGVSLFVNATYVDTTGELVATRAALDALGFPVSTFTGITAADWNTAFGADFVVIPELEKAGITLTAAAIAAINQHLATGKGLVIMGSTGSNEENFLNSLRGWSLTHQGYISSGTMAILPGAPGFANSPAVLTARDATYLVASSSLPAGAEPIYQSGAGTAVFAAGPVAYVGYDWYAGQDSDWTDVLGDAIEATLTRVSGPEIAVEQPAGTALRDGQSTVNFGYAAAASPVERTFTVRNPGTAELNSLAVTIGGANAADFVLTASPAAAVAPAATTTFTVRFTPSANGNRAAVLHLASNDADENPFDVALTGFGYSGSTTGDFQILSLAATGAAVVDHNSLTGDDCGGIAVSGNRVFVTGDDATAGYAPDLTGGVGLGRRVFGLCSDVGSGMVFSLANNGVEVSSSGGTVNQLIALDPVTGALTANVIALSAPVTLASGSGVFSGNGRILLHNGSSVYDILIPSGQVTDLGAMARPAWYSSETWSIWGVAESFGGRLYLAYRKSSAAEIVRTRVPDGLTETIATFTNLSDLASWTVSPATGRWYFHHESGSQFGGSSETLGYAEATFAMGPATAAPVITSPLTAVAYVGTPFSYRIAASNSPTGFAATGLPADLVVNPATGVISGLATAAGVYPVPISATNVIGTTEATLTLTVIAPPSAFFDDFDPGIDTPLWSAFGGTVTANTAGQAAGAGSTGNSLHFDGTGSRFATTVPVDARGTTALAFRIAVAGGAGSSWESADSGDEIVVEYSLNGTVFTQIGGPYLNRTWEPLVVALPAAAKSATTWFRWRQLANSGAGTDHWAIDDVRIDSSVVTVPEIAVEQPVGVNLTDGTAAVAFGPALVGGNASLTFTVRNPGSADLTGLGITIDGANAAEFTVTAAPVAPVAPGATTTFTVRFAPGAVGTRAAVLHLASNDANENPFDIDLGGSGVEASGAVSLFANGTYVDTAQELLSTQTSLQNLGLAVGTFTGITEADWNAAFAADVVIIPELEKSGITLTAGAIAVINQHLAAGKGLVIMGTAASNEESFLNALRGWSLTHQGVISSGTMTILPSAPGFTNSPAVLTARDATYLVTSSTLPAGAEPVYQSGAGTAVFLAGPVAYVGYDWYAGADAAFTNVLGDAFEAVSTPVTGPEISLEQPVGTPLRDGVSTVGFGHALIDSPVALVFTVRNPGTEELTSLAATIDGANAADFVVTAAPAATVAPGASTTFTVRFIPSAGGIRSAALHLASNDPNENPFDLPLSGFGYSSATNLDFQILSLGTTGAAVVDHNSLTADDCGGIAVGSGKVFVTGDTATAGYLLDLTGGASLGRRVAGLCGEFSSGMVFALANNGVEITGGTGTANQLITLDATTGALTGSIIPLSAPVPLASSSGVFSGNGRVVIHNGTNVYDILIPSGLVTDLGAMARPAWYGSETWAAWGVAESFGGRLHLAYRSSSANQIVRTRVPDGLTETIASFTNLGDMASWTVSPATNRWYFHHEGSSQFGGSSETLGYADATFAMGPPTDPPVISSPLTAAAYVGAPFSYRIVASNSATGFAASGLPANLVIDPATGVISGAVSTAGVYPLTISATNVIGTTDATLTLTVTDTLSVFFDDFDPGFDPALWQPFAAGVAANTYGQGPGSTGNSLHFSSTGSRYATTVPVDVRATNALSFLIALANGAGSNWESPDAGEEVVLEYSTDGTAFVQFGGPYNNRTWQQVVAALPAAAKTSATSFRWRQLANSGATNDHWAIDDVRIDSTVTTAPEIAVEQPAGTNLADGTATVSFGNVTTGLNASLTFTVRNAGSEALTGLALTIDGANAAEFTVTATPAASVAAGATTTFSVRFAPEATGARTAVLHLASNDADEHPFDISLSGSGIPPIPEIAVEQPAGANLTDGGAFVNFGSTLVGGAADLVFTIRNSGTGNLTGLGLVIDGANAGDFTVTASPTAPVASGATTTFTVRFSPSAVGNRTAVLHLASNDADENPFDVTLTGIGGTTVTQTLNSTHRGWYDSTGVHTPGNDNYITGWWVDSASKEYRSFFVYDIPALAPGESIVAAELRLENPGLGYASADATETFQLATVTTPTTVLAAGTGGLAVFADLADGALLGNPLTVSAASNGTTLVVPLNASFLSQANTQAGQSLALGGSLSSLRAVAGSQEHLFAYSGGSSAATTLVITKMSNAKPTFSGFAASTPWQTPVLIPLRKLLLKASDPDGDALAVTAAGPASANGGTAALQATGVLFTPPPNFSGTDTFPITLTDARGGFVAGTVTMTVGPAPSAGGGGGNPPVLTPLPGGAMGISFHGIPGRGYTVQRSVGGLNDWVTLATIVADATGLVSYTDPAPPSGSAFYRLGLP